MTARVLVVDDILSNVKLLEAKLSAEYFEVITAYNGLECLAKMESGAPDIVLLDVMMPGMDGLQVCAALHAEHSRVPIILLTAKDDTTTRAEGMHMGVTEFLTKPINRGDLLARVRAQLHVIDLARQLETVERNLRRTPGRPAEADEE